MKAMRNRNLSEFWETYVWRLHTRRAVVAATVYVPIELEWHP